MQTGCDVKIKGGGEGKEGVTFFSRKCLQKKEIERETRVFAIFFCIFCLLILTGQTSSHQNRNFFFATRYSISFFS